MSEATLDEDGFFKPTSTSKKKGNARSTISASLHIASPEKSAKNGKLSFKYDPYSSKVEESPKSNIMKMTANPEGTPRSNIANITANTPQASPFSTPQSIKSTNRSLSFSKEEDDDSSVSSQKISNSLESLHQFAEELEQKGQNLREMEKQLSNLLNEHEKRSEEIKSKSNALSMELKSINDNRNQMEQTIRLLSRQYDEQDAITQELSELFSKADQMQMELSVRLQQESNQSGWSYPLLLFIFIFAFFVSYVVLSSFKLHHNPFDSPNYLHPDSFVRPH
eukprot:TRINITY_DN10172_c0_g1_i1.p1 TRINITY_DN10172_c0_g1~~TRINITY_DN10172_c0_g1_i1.p1  ORF type:complete len:280 (+),score=92.04 TRINITY_DN10172_c0_g1_i1:293-1132(+)